MSSKRGHTALLHKPTNQPTSSGKLRVLAARLGAEVCLHISWTSSIPVSPLSVFLPPSPFVAHEEGLGHLGHPCCPGGSSEAGEVRGGYDQQAWAGHHVPSYPFLSSSILASLWSWQLGTSQRVNLWKEMVSIQGGCSSNSVVQLQLHEITLHF